MYKLLLTICFITPALASDFDDGFKAGYESVEGTMSITPIPPIEPITPIDSTPYLEGIKAGIEAAND